MKFEEWPWHSLLDVQGWLKDGIDALFTVLGVLVEKGMKAGLVDMCEPGKTFTIVCEDGMAAVLDAHVHYSIDWVGFMSPEHASSYMRHPCNRQQMGCLWLLLPKPNTGD